MAQIVQKEELSPDVFRIRLNAPLIASKRKPGQFVILRVTEDGERFPLTISDSDETSISIIVQAVGSSTKDLVALDEGDDLLDLVGPLGCPTEIDKYGTVVCIGGGIGVAPLYPMAKALKEAGNRVVSIMGARNRKLLILENEMKAVSDRLEVTTDDGSYGFHGFVTQVLEQVLEERSGAIRKAYAVGPVPMMKAACEVTKKYGVSTTVSLNPIMVDGTGMCGGCRVTIDGETKFACVDGPEFDGHKVDFDELSRRLNMYTEHEDCRLRQ